MVRPPLAASPTSLDVTALCLIRRKRTEAHCVVSDDSCSALKEDPAHVHATTLLFRGPRVHPALAHLKIRPRRLTDLWTVPTLCANLVPSLLYQILPRFCPLFPSSNQNPQHGVFETFHICHYLHQLTLVRPWEIRLHVPRQCAQTAALRCGCISTSSVTCPLARRTPGTLGHAEPRPEADGQQPIQRYKLRIARSPSSDHAMASAKPNQGIHPPLCRFRC